MPAAHHVFESTIYNKPAISYPFDASFDLQGVTITSNTFEVPLLLTAYTPPTATPKVNIITTVPLMDERSNLSYGGSTLSIGAMDFAKMSLQGTIDTPTVLIDGYEVPSVIADGYRITYPELMIAYWEGRVANRFSSLSALAQEGDGIFPLNEYSWRKVEPAAFRDPYGRVYNHIKVLDFTASYVEAVPGRCNFTLQLMVQ